MADEHLADITMGLTQAPLQLTKAVKIAAGPEEVFAKLTDYAAMPGWFPGMTEVVTDNSAAEAENGTGAVRVCSFGPERMTEDIVLFEPPAKLAYAVRDGNFMGMSGHLALITVEPEEGGSLVTWRQFFEHPDAEAFNEQGGAMLEAALNNVSSHFRATQSSGLLS